MHDIMYDIISKSMILHMISQATHYWCYNDIIKTFDIMHDNNDDIIRDIQKLRDIQKSTHLFSAQTR
jgi:hypothetical protein